MARMKYYRYALREEGKLPKKNFIRMEESPDEYWCIAAYDTILSDSTIKRYNLIDLNEPVKNLTKARVAAGYKQRELAQMTGIAVRTIQAWELTGMGGASLSNTVKIADALGVKDLRTLLDDYDNPN